MLIKPQNPTMNCSDELVVLKLSIECDENKGKAALPEIQLNFDQFLEDASLKSSEQIGPFEFRVNFLQSQNNNNGWGEISEQLSTIVQNKKNCFLDKNFNNNLLLQPQEQASKASLPIQHEADAKNKDEPKINRKKNIKETDKNGISPAHKNSNQQYYWQTFGIFCKRCNKTFTEKPEFDSHYQNDHLGNDIVYSCPQCMHDDQLFNKFRNHCYRHLITGRFKCAECPKRFSQRCHLIEHIKTHSENGKLTCEICNKTFETKPGLNIHNRTHHLKEEFTCSVCHKTLRTFNGYSLHIKTHKRGGQFSCLLCGMYFKQKATLKNHLKIHSRETNHACTMCPKMFFTNSQLNRHMQEHLDVDKFKCDVCAKTFSNEHTLKNHHLTHASTRKYVCQFCNKSFLRPSKLMQHINIHTGEKPHTCQYCERGFTNYPNLHKHVKRVHKVVLKAGKTVYSEGIAAVNNYLRPLITESTISSQSWTTSECSVQSSSVSEYYAASLTPSSEYFIQSCTPSPDGILGSAMEQLPSTERSVIPPTESSIRAVINEKCVNIKENMEYYLGFTDNSSSLMKLFHNIDDLSNADECESIISMDSPENSILLYNERMDSENLDFQFSVDPPLRCTIDECINDSELQLDQNDLLPHNGWQKLNLRDVTLDSSQAITDAFNSKTSNTNNIFANVNESLPLDKLPDQLNFDLDVEIGCFGIQETDQFETDARLSESLRDQELELSHSYVKAQTEECAHGAGTLFEQDADFIHPLILSSLENGLPEIDVQQELLPSMIPYQSQFMDYPQASTTPNFSFEASVDENELLHSLKLAASNMNNQEAELFSTIRQPFSDCQTSVNTENIVLTIESNSPTSSNIYNTIDLKNDLHQNTDANFVDVAPSPGVVQDDRSLSDVNNFISEILSTSEPSNEQLNFMNSANIVDSMSENSTQSNYIKMLTNQTSQKITNTEQSASSEQSADLLGSDLCFQLILNNIIDSDSNIDNFLDSVEHLQTGPNFLANDLQLSAFIQPLMFEEKLKPSDAFFSVQPSPTVLRQ